MCDDGDGTLGTSGFGDGLVDEEARSGVVGALGSAVSGDWRGGDGGVEGSDRAGRGVVSGVMLACGTASTRRRSATGIGPDVTAGCRRTAVWPERTVAVGRKATLESTEKAKPWARELASKVNNSGSRNRDTTRRLVVG